MKLLSDLITTLQSSMTIALMMFLLGIVYGKSKQFGDNVGKKNKRYFMSVISFVLAMIFFSIYLSSDTFDHSIAPGFIGGILILYALKSPYSDLKKSGQKFVERFN